MTDIFELYDLWNLHIATNIYVENMCMEKSLENIPYCQALWTSKITMNMIAMKI